MNAKKIKEARIKKNLTQRQLAELLGVRYEAVCSWENGRTVPRITKRSLVESVLEIKLNFKKLD